MEPARWLGENGQRAKARYLKYVLSARLFDAAAPGRAAQEYSGGTGAEVLPPTIRFGGIRAGKRGMRGCGFQRRPRPNVA